MRGDVLIERHLIGPMPPAPETMAVAGLIDGYAVNPGAKARLAAKTVNGAENAEEDLLGEIERFVAVAKQVHGQLHDHPLVLAHQIGTSHLIARGAAFDQGRFATVDVRPPDDPGLFHDVVHYTKLDPGPGREFPRNGPSATSVPPGGDGGSAGEDGGRWRGRRLR